MAKKKRNKKTPEQRLSTLKGVAGRVCRLIGRRRFRPVQEAVAEAEAAVAAIPNPGVGVTPAAVAEARQAAIAAINTAWDTLNAAQWAWAVERTLAQQTRLARLDAAKHFEIYMKYFADFQKAFRAAADAISAAMNYQGRAANFAELVRRNEARLNKAWRLYVETREAGGLKASVVFDGKLGGKLDAAGIVVEKLVRMTDEEILALDGIGPAGLKAIREKIPEPKLADQLAAAAKVNSKNPRSLGARARVVTE